MAQAGCDSRSGEPLVASGRSYLTDITGESELTTWDCTGDPCPWGPLLSNPAIVWPVSAAPVAIRHGYTVSPAAYLPASSANGLIVSIEFGSADLFAGEPLASSHDFLATISAGQSFEVAGLGADEVLSVQSDASFGYHLTQAPPPVDPPDAGTPPDAGAPPDPGPGGDPSSQSVTWTCNGSPCPWGGSLSGEALVWSATAGALSRRLGYVTSAGVYLPAARANGATVLIKTGAAGVFAGFPGDEGHRVLGTVTAGQTFHVNGLAVGEVVSLQADARFTYVATLPPPGEPGPGGDPDADVIQSTKAFWRCNIPDCFGADWVAAVIPWPASAAYQNNARAGNLSRSVFAADGSPLFPYMGAWADGCEVTAESGTVLIIEWQRGTDVWRETWLEVGQSHVIDLVAPEDGAMIETFDGSPGFSVSLKNCTPQPLP